MQAPLHAGRDANSRNSCAPLPYGRILTISRRLLRPSPRSRDLRFRTFGGGARMGSTPSPLGVLLPSTFTKGGERGRPRWTHVGWTLTAPSRLACTLRAIVRSCRLPLVISFANVIVVLHEPRERVAPVPAHKFSGETHAISEHRYARRSFHPLSQFDGAADRRRNACDTQ